MVSINGTRLPPPAVVSLEVTNSSHFTADTYRVELAVGGLPAGMGPAYWAASRDDRVTLAVSLAGETPSPLVTGRVDDVSWDLPGRTLTLSGRDLSAALIDNKTAEKFQNRTASQIAATLAARRGLTADVQATTTPAGTYFSRKERAKHHRGAPAMFRKLTLAAVLATGTVAGLTGTASAHPPVEYRHHRFEVLVECGHRWEPRGTFGDRFEAERAANRLRHEGFRVEIREC